ncbi:hypothetical protein [Frigoriglobus tundricola]|uniref:Uncharacterized protein n=1 Tax=Frigoriglobus tundricola TaxID=2774151 RepID=A0A6M5YWM6_9BACT|nr:hypothetical protein [Frigoriglobus tundricola]QJW97900.1 hypothetical protein FTUN_5480 [Frigoriglobus tundricola]
MRWAWLIVVCASAVGCVTHRDPPPVAAVARSLSPAVPAEGMNLESVLLERPIGDRFLDRDLWAAALPVGGQEARVLLTENGLRAGVLTGNLPQQFQTLLESESEALNARRLTFAVRKDEVLPTTGPLEKCEFGLLTDIGPGDTRTRITLPQARCGVMVRPEAMADDRVRVACEPQIQYGDRQEFWRASADGTGWVKSEEVPLKTFPMLAFDVPLGRNEYLVIGWSADQPDTIGAALFGVSANGQARQRVLVIRARQLNPGAPADLPSLGPIRRPSIAAEANKLAR